MVTYMKLEIYNFSARLYLKMLLGLAAVSDDIHVRTHYEFNSISSHCELWSYSHCSFLPLSCINYF